MGISLSGPKNKKGYGSKFACWNVRTVLDSDKNDWPQRRSALVVRELSRLNIDIAAISEVRFAEQGFLIVKEQAIACSDLRNLRWENDSQKLAL